MSEQSIVRLCKTGKKMLIFQFTVELGYNNLSLHDTSAIVLYLLWYQLIPHKACCFLPCLYVIRKCIYLGYNTIASHLFQ